MAEVFKSNKVFFILYGIFLIAGGIWQVLWSPTQIFLVINGANHPFSDTFFQYFTNVGDGAFFAAVIILFLFIRYRYVLIGLGSFALSSLVAQGLKRLVFADVLRPKAVFEGSSYAVHWVAGLEIHSNNSFPSGHATTAFAVFSLLSIILKNQLSGFLFFTLAFLAAYSRVYLGQHFFADIYAGSLIGVSSTVFMYLVIERLLERNPKNWYQQNILRL
ncbi:phosphatase PAP2 family protein [Cytophagaceae bacterium DM2B3-1]|uniref:Phosphatase PAP2 family protein n=1 Tax=Xanthocytophaga flava TaxID=3048013 RepID=A0AAE3QPT8_9BACT|nr:phosphatase PAP2 family protein [Xanthocytophaga flavus]MDJ1483252.1 phosphatase PAP2 family protein [Xanthocytophaga flavus]MDJ1494361.1 phosphatase PAP2 family protein [Xanthocytophaga flavus]